MPADDQHPRGLRPQTAAEAIAEMAAEAAQRDGITLHFDLDPGIQLPSARRDALVRIAAEAVTNAARHSGATLVDVSLHRHGPQVHLRVADYGCGFEPEVRAAGFGLVSMRERVGSVGGDLRISSCTRTRH